MKKYILLFSVFFTFHIHELFAQNCTGDSVVITTRYDDAYDLLTRIVTDSFDINTGIQTQCISTIDQMGNIGPATCTTQTFIRFYLERNHNMDTLVFVRMQGTGSGFTNFKKTEYIYQPVIDKPLTRIEYLWNGVNWIPKFSETWNYDINNNLSGYLKQIDKGSGLENVQRRTYAIANGIATELLFQNDSMGSWINQQKYLITHSISGERDSLYIQFWNQYNSIWFDSIACNYQIQPINNELGVEITWASATYDSEFGTWYYDTLISIIDTSDNIIFQEHPGLYQNSHQQYKYYNYTQLIKSDVSDDYGCISNDSYFYDNHGILTGTHYHGACSMPSSSGSSFSYDSLYRLTGYSGNISSNIGTYIIHDEIYYSDFNQIGLSYLDPMQYAGHLCPGNTVNTVPLVSGGCGPYHFQWYPATGLSSDTLSNPEITIPEDSIAYNVTVSDSIGNSTSITFYVYPFTPDIPVISYQAPLLVSSYARDYQWYYNGTMLINDTNQSLLPINDGIYTVVTHDFFGCLSDTGEFNYIHTSTGEVNNNKLQVFPNPANNEIILDGLYAKSEIFMCDITGKIIERYSEKNIANGRMKISCAELSDGIYFLRILSDKIRTDRKIIVQH